MSLIIAVQRAAASIGFLDPSDDTPILPIVVDVAEEPGGDLVEEQVIIHVGFGHGVAGDGTEFIGRELRIGCEFPTGTYHRRQT